MFTTTFTQTIKTLTFGEKQRLTPAALIGTLGIVKEGKIVTFEALSF
jgi:hypothetical protein